MILFKKLASDKVRSYIYCANQFLHEKHHKKWNQECKQKHSLLFSFCSIFNLLTSRTPKIAWWPPVLKPDSWTSFYWIKLSTFTFVFYFMWNAYLRIWIINSFTTSRAFTNTDSKRIIKSFIRVYIEVCWSSVTWLIV